MRKSQFLDLAKQLNCSDSSCPQFWSTSFVTFGNFVAPADMSIRMSNIPAFERKTGRPVVLSHGDLCRIQLGNDPNTLTQDELDKLDEEILQQMEAFKTQTILEYKAEMVVKYGKDDFLTGDEALACPELNLIGKHILEWIHQGVMDVVVFNECPEMEVNGRDVRKRRPREFAVDLYWLRRILAQDAVGQSIWFDGDRQPARRFGRLTGRVQNVNFGRATITTHVVFGRMPRPNAKRRPLDKKSSVLGQDGRGFLFVLKVCDVNHGFATYQQLLLPDELATLQAASGETIKPSPQRMWLDWHPTPDDRVPFLKKLLELQAEQRQADAATSESDDAEVTDIAVADASVAAEVQEPTVEADPTDPAAYANEVMAPDETVPQTEAAPEQSAQASADAAPQTPSTNPASPAEATSAQGQGLDFLSN